jgi:2-polyprenyl-3-methyl-5-hydroxy-6-metoxy-1,4-benzoquinol methylase
MWRLRQAAVSDGRTAKRADPGSGYPEWTFSGEADNHHYLVPAVLAALPEGPGTRVLDLGCGNGALTGRIRETGAEVVGVDFTESGLDRARAAVPGVEFRRHDLTEPLPPDLCGAFDAVVAAEVIEHLFLPSVVFDRCAEALAPGGRAVISTPFHGYWKNLAIVLAGRSDRHWSPLADYGHIKFFSPRTLTELARTCGFEPVALRRAGRVPPFSATMVMTALPRR